MYERQFYYENTSIVQLSPSKRERGSLDNGEDVFSSVNTGSNNRLSGATNEAEFRIGAESNVSLISDDIGGSQRPNLRPSEYQLMNDLPQGTSKKLRQINNRKQEVLS